MTHQENTDQLERIASANDFPAKSAELTAAWSSAGVGIESVEPIHRFMEQYPIINFGAPGPLVHFVERFYSSGYEGNLAESIHRKPTPLTIWMLSRIINATKLPDIKERLIALMENAKRNPLADQKSLENRSVYRAILKRADLKTMTLARPFSHKNSANISSKMINAMGQISQVSGAGTFRPETDRSNDRPDHLPVRHHRRRWGGDDHLDPQIRRRWRDTADVTRLTTDGVVAHEYWKFTCDAESQGGQKVRSPFGSSRNHPLQAAVTFAQFSPITPALG